MAYLVGYLLNMEVERRPALEADALILVYPTGITSQNAEYFSVKVAVRR
jgi:hypothetical protein